jgi:predicted transcriptional regulator
MGKAAAWAAASAAVLLPAYLLWHALFPAGVFRHRAPRPSLREEIAAAVGAEPGIHHMQLVRRIGKGNGTVQYHVGRLIKAGKVVRVRAKGYACYFLNGSTDSGLMAASAALRSGSAQRILEQAVAGPSRSLSELATDLGLSVSTVHYHVGRLAEAHVLRVEKAGPARVITAAEAGRTWLATRVAPQGVAIPPPASTSA